MLLGALDTYVVVGVLTDIIRDLGIPVNHLEQATPIVTGYLLGYVAAMPLLGQLSDRFGRRMVLQLCLVAFAVGSVLTAQAGTVPALVVGRVLQGASGGALLPVTIALVGDLWPRQGRSTALGMVGSSQELGSVLGPLYGIAVAGLFDAWQLFHSLQQQSWRWIFWINLPLALIAMMLVHRAVPAGPSRAGARQRMDLVGGGLLATALGVLIVGLYNPDPEHSVLSPWGLPFIGIAVLVFVAFLWWERRATVRLIDARGVSTSAFLGIVVTSFLAGSALMVTLVDVELVAQTLLGKSSQGAAAVLVAFLVGLPVGALLGGWGSNWRGERPVVCFGMLLAAAGYLLISRWPVDVFGLRHWGLFPVLPTDLAIAGIGLGLIIAPLSAAMLHVVPAAQHATGSAVVVVARMTGMLVGIAALTAWGLHRFHVLTVTLNTPLPFGVTPETYAAQLTRYQIAVHVALHSEYSDIFRITAVMCLAGAATSLLLTTSRSRQTMR